MLSETFKVWMAVIMTCLKPPSYLAISPPTTPRHVDISQEPTPGPWGYFKGRNHRQFQWGEYFQTRAYLWL